MISEHGEPGAVQLLNEWVEAGNAEITKTHDKMRKLNRTAVEQGYSGSITVTHHYSNGMYQRSVWSQSGSEPLGK